MSRPHPPVRAASARRLLTTCFFLSGFTALLYQTVWMRLSLAKFGVNTSVVATVLSTFMLGLALGSVLAGRLLARAEARFGIGPLSVYGAAELVVGVGGFVVPSLLAAGRDAILSIGPASGARYTIASMPLLAAALLPFCTAMGLTFPAAIAFLRAAGAAGEGREPFSALYLANVVGALAGALATPLVFIELYGFLATCRAAALVNLTIAITALVAFRGRVSALALAAPKPKGDPSRIRLYALFATGFSTMGMEVVWMRMYPRVVGTMVYSFATIVAVYLFATTAGSALYRRYRGRELAGRVGVWFPWLCAASFLPLLSASVRFPELYGPLRVLIGLTPFCALLGFVTPALVDREAGDDPSAVGRAYGLNLLGCLLGPLAAGFVLLPVIGTRGAAVVLALPLFGVLLSPTVRREIRPRWTLAALAASGVVLFATTLFEEQFPKEHVGHDHVATVVVDGEGMKKKLYVNGVTMTDLSSATKMMAHFPAAHLTRREGPPIDALVICFGMGTTFRSLAAWDARVTAVELVPSVSKMFGFFFPEGPELVRASTGRLVIVNDDGRRFLDRSPEQFDLITIDPPPPVEAAGSGMLYSKEFYASAKRRMKPGAILQTWLPGDGGDRETIAAVTLSALESFPHVRVFASIYGNGFHFLMSNDPIPRLSADRLVAQMPAAAVADMQEWMHAPPRDFFTTMLSREYNVDSLLIGRSRTVTLAISDDRPVNEFYFLRRTKAYFAGAKGGR